MSVEVKNLVKIYGEQRAVNNISFTAKKGEVLGFLGPNGAGKSLILRLMAGLIAPQGGKILWDGQTPNPAWQRKIGLVLQKPVMFKRKVIDNLCFAHKLTGISKKQALNMAKQQLGTHQLSHLANQFAPTLSGGEQQQIALLRAMALRPSCLLLDEPTANLDPISCARIEGLVRDISQHIPCLFVTHNIQQARRLADWILYLDEGKLDICLSASAFFENPPSQAAQDFLNGVMPTCLSH